MNFYRNLIISFSVAIITLMLGVGGYTIYAETKKEDFNFSNPKNGFNSVKSNYHRYMNEYFNEKLKIMVDLTEDPNFYKHPNFTAPKEKSGCTPQNVSTYCVSMGALDIYMNYLQTLNQLKGFLPLGELPEGATTEDLLNADTVENGKIDKEMEEAKSVMLKTVAAYDEFRVAYPVHQRYEDIIKNLIKYKIALGKVKKQTQKFPLKFIDATSAQCK